MIDASGKHTWGLFSGNRYWLGAPDQCREMENDFADSKKEGSILHNMEIPPFTVNVDAISLTLKILKPGIKGVCFIHQTMPKYSLFSALISFRSVLAFCYLVKFIFRLHFFLLTR